MLFSMLQSSTWRRQNLFAKRFGDGSMGGAAFIASRGDCRYTEGPFRPNCMKLLDKIGREFSGYNILESGKRLVDRKPLQCSLYVTDRCDLEWAYCTEYDNSQPHPSLDDLKKWIRKIRELGTMRIALVGGEPLVHPNIVEIVRYCRELGFATSLTT